MYLQRTVSSSTASHPTTRTTLTTPSPYLPTTFSLYHPTAPFPIPPYHPTTLPPYHPTPLTITL